MEEKALETMGENKASYMMKDAINKHVPASDQKVGCVEQSACSGESLTVTAGREGVQKQLEQRHWGWSAEHAR